MTTRPDRVVVRIGLDTKYPAQASYNTLFIVDDDLIPTDVLMLTVPVNDRSDIVGTSGTLYDICQAYFQTSDMGIGPPDYITFGRAIETASSPFFVCGSAWETDYTVYKAITDGSFSVTDGTNTDDITAVDGSSINSFADYLVVLNAKLAALTPTITGLDTAAFTVDPLGRLTLTNSTTGASAATISIITNATGTDLAAAAYFDAANGAAYPGIDAKTLLQSYTDVQEKFDDYWGVMARGGDDDEMKALAMQVNSETHFMFLKEDSANATNPAVSTDLLSSLDALGVTRCAACFSYTGDYPEVAQVGAVIAADPGSATFGFTQLAGEPDSGQAINNYRLTGAQKTALDNKNYNYIRTVADYKTAEPGRTIDGREIRMFLGRDWMSNRIQTEVYVARIQRRILGFDNASLAVIEEILIRVLEEAKTRNIITSYVLTMPTEDDFSAAQKATHILEIDAFQAEAVTDAWKYEIAGRITLDLPAAA